MFGFVGCVVLILTYILLIWRIVHIARTTRKDLGGYICFGVAAVLFAQTVENLGMCLAMLPVVGITLPFMSYGGSSVLAIYMMAGVLHSIHAHHEKPMSYYSSKKS
jgi:rod shape determining protein RodA